MARDGHRERPQVVEEQTGHQRVTREQCLSQPVVVGMATLEGAVDEDQDDPLVSRFNGHGSTVTAWIDGFRRHDRMDFPPPPPMTIALLIALAGSLGLMTLIVRKLDKA